MSYLKDREIWLSRVPTATSTFRRSGNEIQILITGGGGVTYYVQLRIQGSKASN